jgi:hypothetical protein
MYDADSTQDHELTTEQIASAGTAPAQQDGPAPAGRLGYEDDDAAPFAAEHAASGQAGDDAPYASHDAPYASHDAPYAGDDAPYAGDDAPYAGNGARVAADPGQRASLLEDGELQGITARWKDIQAEFVEEPTEAVRQADELVAELMQRLAAMFTAERAELENRLAGGNEVSTEDLRQGLRRYRSFFERLLAA